MSGAGGSLEEIDAYLGGRDVDESFEDALFLSAAAGDAAAAEYFAFRASLLDLVRRGTYDVVITSAQAEAVRASEWVVTSIDVPLGAPSAVGEPNRAADILLIRVELPLADVQRLDVEMLAGEIVVKTIDDVTFEPSAGLVYFACEGQLALAAGASGVRHRFVAIEASGRRVLREYGFEDVR